MSSKFALSLFAAILVGRSTTYGETIKEKCGMPMANTGTKWQERALCIVKEHCPKCSNMTIADISPPAPHFTFVGDGDIIESFNAKFKKTVQFDGIDCPDAIHIVLEPMNPGLIKYMAAVTHGFVFKIDGLYVRDGTVKYNKSGQRLKIKVRDELAKFLGKTKFEVIESTADGPKEADVTHVKINENIKRCGLTVPAGSTLSYMGTTENQLFVKPSRTMTVNGIPIRPTHEFVIMQGEICDLWAITEEEAKKRR